MPKLSLNGHADNKMVRRITMVGSSEISGFRVATPKVKRVLHYYSYMNDQTHCITSIAFTKSWVYTKQLIIVDAY